MKITALFIVFTLFCENAWPGLPPTTVKDSNDSVAKTTFNLQLPAMAGTHAGTTYSLGVTTTPTASFFAGWDANKNLSANNFIAGYATTATSGGTTTLTATDARKQVFTGTSNQTVQLPAVSTIAQGTDFIIQNNSTGIVTVTSSGGNVITTLANQQLLPFTSNATSGTGASVWDYPSVLGQVAQTADVGSLTYAATTGCTFSLSTQSSFTDISANASCPTATVTGNVSAPATKIPAVVLSGAPGTYYFFLADEVFVSPSDLCLRMTDGTDSSSAQCMTGQNAGTAAVNSTSSQVFKIIKNSSFSNDTFKLQYHTNGTANAGGVFIRGNSGADISISVVYVPNQSQTVASLASVSANWSGYQTVGSGWTVTASTYTDLAAGTSIVTTANGTPHGISCVTNASSKAGIDCTLPKTGNLRIKADIVNGSTGTATASYRIVDGSGSVIDPGRSNAVSAGNYFPMHLEGGYTASSTSVTFKIQGATNAATASIFNGLAAGSAAIQWNVEQIDSPGPQPYATGNVSSTTSGQDHLMWAIVNSVCSSTPCTISSQSGSWLTSITRNALGDYTANIAAGVCSGQPTLWGTAGGDGTGSNRIRYKSLVSNPPTSTQVRFVVGNSSGAADDDFTINVDCPH